MELEKRVKELELLSGRNARKLSHTVITLAAMYMAVSHKDDKNMKLPFIISLAVLCVDAVTDLIYLLKKMKAKG